ncbi:hypothetical protein CAPN004_23790 [Capnocytophaga cynodegmi]|uniref:hypothetical protein n=1 Tax=Capnocytophaga cynodegmi TaxID=28189 RepID=UPI001AD0C751|nr:hypothetical protein [Capnocytophaga cynodegmi]GIM53350.1 hypothetical protein CAPN004_23790 [Capnocytophaga cynodegmi]
MYKYIAKKKANLPQIWKDKIFTLTEFDDKSSLVEIDNEFDFKWIGLENNIYSFTILGDLIIYEVDNEYTLARNLESLEMVYIFDNPITIFDENCDKNYYYHNTKKMGFIKFDYLKGKVNKVFLENRYNGLHKLLGDFLILYRDKIISIHSKTNFSLLWQKDLSDITSYEYWGEFHQGNVKNVYLYENKLIVVAGNSVLAMNIETADILWQIKYNDFQPFTLHINNHFAYLSKGTFYSVIDLEKGEKVLETMLIRPFDHDPEYEKANLAMVGSDMTFYDNYLYFTDKHKGRYYLAKLNPHTAQIEEYQFLEEVKSNLAPPKFYDDKMFLLDSNNNLFIYERE